MARSSASGVLYSFSAYAKSTTQLADMQRTVLLVCIGNHIRAAYISVVSVSISYSPSISMLCGATTANRSTRHSIDKAGILWQRQPPRCVLHDLQTAFSRSVHYTQLHMSLARVSRYQAWL